MNLEEMCKLARWIGLFRKWFVSMLNVKKKKKENIVWIKPLLGLWTSTLQTSQWCNFRIKVEIVPL